MEKKGRDARVGRASSMGPTEMGVIKPQGRNQINRILSVIRVT